MNAYATSTNFIPVDKVDSTGTQLLYSYDFKFSTKTDKFHFFPYYRHFKQHILQQYRIQTKYSSPSSINFFLFEETENF